MKLYRSCMFPYSLYSCKNKYWPPLRDYLYQLIFVLPQKQRWDRSRMWRGATVSVNRHTYIYCIPYVYFFKCVCAGVKVGRYGPVLHTGCNTGKRGQFAKSHIQQPVTIAFQHENTTNTRLSSRRQLFVSCASRYNQVFVHVPCSQRSEYIFTVQT